MIYVIGRAEIVSIWEGDKLVSAAVLAPEEIEASSALGADNSEASLEQAQKVRMNQPLRMNLKLRINRNFFIVFHRCTHYFKRMVSTIGISNFDISFVSEHVYMIRNNA